MKSSCRLITDYDIPLLLKWRNNNRQAFFDKEEVSADKHINWYFSYIMNLRNLMFMVLCDNHPIGCIGVKGTGEAWELYNVIRGRQDGKGCMGDALSHIIHKVQDMINVPVLVKVLKENKAIRWYQQNGFEIYEEQENYFSLRFRNR